MPALASEKHLPAGARLHREVIISAQRSCDVRRGVKTKPLMQDQSDFRAERGGTENLPLPRLRAPPMKAPERR